MKNFNHIVTFIWLLLLSMALSLDVDGRILGDDDKKRIKCGKKNCKKNEYCCNKSCSICSKKGTGCNKKICLPPVPSPTVSKNNDNEGIQCGKMMCQSDESCCNSSCSICVKKGSFCKKIQCHDD